MSAKLVPTFADRGCRVVSATDPQGHILGFLDRGRYYFFQVTPQLYSRCWVDPIPDLLLLRKSGSAENRARDLWICSQELWPLDHRGGHFNSSEGNKWKKIITSFSLCSFLFNFPFSNQKMYYILIDFILFKSQCSSCLKCLLDNLKIILRDLTL
jgi:hypothetical protein